MTRMSYEVFIKRARKIHEDKYHYPDKETFDKYIKNNESSII